MAFVAAAPLLWTTIASTALSAFSAISQGEQQSERNKAAARAEEYNAAVARNRAANTAAAYSQREDQQRRQARMIIGEQRAAGAQSGLANSGSIADAEEMSVINAELDSLNIRYKGSLESQGLLSQADMNDYSASGYRSAAKSAKTNSYLAAGSAILSGAAKYAGATSGWKPNSDFTSFTPTLD